MIDDLMIQHNPISMVSEKSTSRSQLNRNTIKRIKKDLVNKDPKYDSLKKKFLGLKCLNNQNDSHNSDSASNNELEQEHLLASDDHSY
jgi:hypothetical protein